jgi:hypothetical protein
MGHSVKYRSLRQLALDVGRYRAEHARHNADCRNTSTGVYARELDDAYTRRNARLMTCPGVRFGIVSAMDTERERYGRESTTLATHHVNRKAQPDIRGGTRI